MVHVRAHDGAPPGHPMTVVPRDPGRRGALVRVRGWEIAVADPVREITTVPDLAAAAEDVRWAADRIPDAPPFIGGLLGFLSDDLSPTMVGLPTGDIRPEPAPLGELWFGEYRHAACQDPSGRWWVVGRTAADADAGEALLREATGGSGHLPDQAARLVPPGSAQDPPGTAGTATARALRSPTSSVPHDPGAAPVWTSIDQAAHEKAVLRIQDWIADGDVYQVNLTMHVSAPWEGSTRRLALNLFGASHGAAHASYLHAPGATIASISPETFLRLDGRHAQVRPIKGTRRRSPDPRLDRRLADDLLAAHKDSAEHVMIVDLERNDLGRISEVGSVAVPELMALEGHPTVWHLTSTVTSRIRADVDFAEVLGALFPCGSITGAPKRMAVERIRQIEPWRRGVYCGAIGVITRGLVDLSVAIRTAVVLDGRAWYGTGGGIVADSDPAEEWDEAMAKAEAFMTAVRQA